LFRIILWLTTAAKKSLLQHLPRGHLSKLCAADGLEVPIISALNFPLHSAA
jgi:hypothetical protein